MNHDITSPMYKEILAIAKKVTSVCHDLSPEEREKLASSSIPGANQELDAVVKATEKATNTILDAAEAIQKQLGGVNTEASKAITAQITSIFEACNFQDITGQHIKKVVKTLFEIETMLNNLIGISGVSGAGPKGEKSAVVSSPSKDDDSRLMNGPQIKPPTQEEIDRLFADKK